VTWRPNCSGPSRREVKNDVCQYLQTVVMGLYAVCEQKLARPDRVLSLDEMCFKLDSTENPRSFEKYSTRGPLQ